jgi:hypothetical protein
MEAPISWTPTGGPQLSEVRPTPPLNPITRPHSLIWSLTLTLLWALSLLRDDIREHLSLFLVTECMYM